MPLQQQMRFFLRATGALHEASVLMLRLSYPTETVLSNRNRIVLSFKDSPRKPLRRQPMAAYSKHVSLLYCCCCCISNFNDDDDGAQFFSSRQGGDGSSGLVRLVPSEREGGHNSSVKRKGETVIANALSNAPPTCI